MPGEIHWKVLLLLAGSVALASDNPTAVARIKARAPYPMFVPKSRRVYRRLPPRQRVIFLDEEENGRHLGKGEIDLTNSDKIKFDNTEDYEFTSEDGSEVKPPNAEVNLEPSGTERFYENPVYPRVKPYNHVPNYYQGRYGRYAPNHYQFEPFVPYSPAVRFYNGNGWKARSPRVIFPHSPDNGVNQPTGNFHTNSHGGPTVSLNDVVFREQNFGLQDFQSDDLNLQDLGNVNSEFPDKGE
ncbi:hypothetical protein EVAR_50797_1 [Eumeta japonica]|uniref:Uncharacterized protein n=1 Tax=Eumeta variegata TaxID=151549 RepID=A0A4C1XGK2_EUMVA|nr:hypothetical protein EVAR_50797_1 [Eumeta japonica]